MTIDEARSGDAVTPTDGLLRRIVLADLRALADRNDLALPHGDGAVADDAAGRIDGDQPVGVVGDEGGAFYCISQLRSWTRGEGVPPPRRRIPSCPRPQHPNHPPTSPLSARYARSVP